MTETVETERETELINLMFSLRAVMVWIAKYLDLNLLFERATGYRMQNSLGFIDFMEQGASALTLPKLLPEKILVSFLNALDKAEAGQVAALLQEILAGRQSQFGIILYDERLHDCIVGPWEARQKLMIWSLAVILGRPDFEKKFGGAFTLLRQCQKADIGENWQTMVENCNHDFSQSVLCAYFPEISDWLCRVECTL